eukprot:3992199-Amphidinium_carterae.1
MCEFAECVVFKDSEWSSAKRGTRTYERIWVGKVLKSDAHMLWNNDQRQIKSHHQDGQKCASSCAERQWSKEPVHSILMWINRTIQHPDVAGVRAEKISTAMYAGKDSRRLWKTTAADMLVQDNPYVT